MCTRLIDIEDQHKLTEGRRALADASVYSCSLARNLRSGLSVVSVEEEGRNRVQEKNELIAENVNLT